MIFNHKDGKTKIHWGAVSVILTALVLFATIIGSHALSQQQTKLNTKAVAEIKKDTTEKTEGTLKSDVIKNSQDVFECKSEVKLAKQERIQFKETLDEVKRAQNELVKTVNNEAKASYERHDAIMKLLYAIKKDGN